MNLKEQYEAAVKAARELHAKYGTDMTDEQFTEVKSALDKVDDLGEKLQKAEEESATIDRLRSLNLDGGTDGRKNAHEPEAKSIGAHFVKSARDRLSEQASGRRIEFSAPEFDGTKAADDPHKTTNLSDEFNTLYGTQVERGIVNARRERLVAADLMGSATVTLPTIKYLVEKAKRMIEGTPGTVAEGARKPYVKFDEFDVRTESLSKIAALTKISDEMIEDYGFVADWINQQLIYELSVVEEEQLLRGDGAGSNLTGLLQRDGLQDFNIDTDDTSDQFDGLFRAIQMIPAATNLTADAMMINPIDYAELRLHKDANGQYVAGGPFANGQYGVGGVLIDPPVWGLRTVATNAVPQGRYVVGAFRQGATVLRKGGLRVDSTNTNDTDFDHNLVTLRAEERLGLMVPVPSAFVTGQLGSTTGGGDNGNGGEGDGQGES
ncbi:phage major capsid protein [Corynebacterium glyciniphilum]|uniref:phage major capsid protein n=1 Tax=Corynebacterium glyciniphilum TaxID=1404244 RepID=UPI0026572001|nr:phage major capsid protein [Corynebacterium glyciniphilum]MDN6707027.1 phage major capsid protein [Corynebacterium glyciniphilum]